LHGEYLPPNAECGSVLKPSGAMRNGRAESSRLKAESNDNSGLASMSLTETRTTVNG
jgi:hypothetical protein